MAYKDQFGYLTVGVGRNLDANPLTPSEIAVCGSDARTAPITHDAAIYLLHNDEGKVMAELSQIWPWWLDLDDVRARVLVDLCFNMGPDRLKKFRMFITYLSNNEFDEAAAALKDSLWYNQVGNRGPRLVGMVKTGEDYTA